MTADTDTDVLEVRPDGRTSRLLRKESASHNENPDDISTVDTLVAEFRRQFPDGLIDPTQVKQIGENAWLVTARVWKDRRHSTGLPDSAGSAVRIMNLDGHAAEAFPLESAQSVAILRAIRFMALIEQEDT